MNYKLSLAKPAGPQFPDADSSLDFAENVQRYRPFIFHNTIYRGQKHLSNHSYA